eukprot:CAMPEP_0181116714 /NCGR_PEP_ID=MMETSP1071-20121207/22105_1 /TAXON_ID=35127 /ORGANISM="Thalassiosira sp., Strain NH16" /LENGTH=290 /DNA_ID=CAMNT_0023200991 /DNA_START=184 /DNA_END=1052 /DNA_ORIENTATION=+
MPQTKRVTNNPFHLLSKIFDLHLPYLATTLHLQIELALWICTLLLTGASSVVLYKRSYLHTTGDWAFLTWVGVWLGRHFVMRLACTMTWADPPSSASSSSSSSGGEVGHGSRSFATWLHRRRMGRSAYHRIRWALSLLSPHNLCSALARFVQTCAMAGQYCDSGAARGVASAAVAVAGGGTTALYEDHHHHHHAMHHHVHGHSSKGSGSSHGFSHHGGHGMFGPYPQSIHVHAAVILSLARSWGTLCGLSFAIWSLLRGEGGGMRGAVGEVVGLVGGVLWSWTKSCLSLV